jgi:hypothetical protein
VVGLWGGGGGGGGAGANFDEVVRSVIFINPLSTFLTAFWFIIHFPT